MKKILALMLFTVLAANPVFAQQGNKQGGMMGHDSGMGMMNGEQMQERMQRMQGMMERDSLEEE